MSISYQVLGKISGDNALIVHLDSGQSIEHLLFDCGEGCLAYVPNNIIQKIDHLFFSHLHMDHIAGFDSFFRVNFNRRTKPNHIWGPPHTAKILQHRFQGYMWNLLENMHATWLVSDINKNKINTYRYELGEAFSIMHDFESASYTQTIYDTENYTVEAITLNHHVPSIGYIIREKPRLNIDKNRMASLGISSEPWLRKLKEQFSPDTVSIDGTLYSFLELRKQLLTETPGESIAYLTDFLADDTAIEQLIPFLRNCNTLICESQYRGSDEDLANKNFHCTSVKSAIIASRAQVGKLVLFHLSDRYTRQEYLESLHEAQQIFPHTSFPLHWKLH